MNPYDAAYLRALYAPRDRSLAVYRHFMTPAGKAALVRLITEALGLGITLLWDTSSGNEWMWN